MVAEESQLHAFSALHRLLSVINSQLTQLQRDTGTMELLSTNNSALQLGYYLFAGHALMVFLASSLIDKLWEKRTCSTINL
jgi:hypothetical protein